MRDNKTTANNTMKKNNWYINIGVGFLALAILLKILNLQYNMSNFVQGFSIGLGLVLIIKGFLVMRKQIKEQLATIALQGIGLF